MILVPRTELHLQRTLRALAGVGLTNTIPLAISQPQLLEIPKLPAANSIIFTSAVAVRPELPRLPCYCVGTATAETAEAMGFPILLEGAGNAAELAAQILPTLSGPHHFLHPHGDHASASWYKVLKSKGHKVTPVVVYQTNRITALPHTVVQQLQKSPATHTLLFSAGTAQHLAKLLKQANIPLTGTAIVVSPAVTLAAKPLWPKVLTASEPSLAATVNLLKKNIKA